MGPKISMVNFHTRTVGTKSPPKIQPGKDITQLAIKWHAVGFVQDGGRQVILKEHSVPVTPISLTWRTKFRKCTRVHFLSETQTDTEDYQQQLVCLRGSISWI